MSTGERLKKHLDENGKEYYEKIQLSSMYGKSGDIMSKKLDVEMSVKGSFLTMDEFSKYKGK